MCYIRTLYAVYVVMAYDLSFMVSTFGFVCCCLRFSVDVLKFGVYVMATCVQLNNDARRTGQGHTYT